MLTFSEQYLEAILLCLVMIEVSISIIALMHNWKCIPPSPRLVCVETNPGPSSHNKNKNKNKNNNKHQKHSNRPLKTVSVTTGRVEDILSHSVMDPCTFPKRLGIGQVFNVNQSYENLTWITSSTTVPTYQNMVFQLSNVSNVTALVGLFDQYRVKMIEVTLLPQNNNATNTATLGNGLFHSVIDYDNQTNLTSIAGANEYENCVVSEGMIAHRRTFVPRLAIAAYGSGAFTSFANEQDTWLDCANQSIPHYGVKAAWTATGYQQSYDMYVRAWLQFRCVI
jgi:hypothetical protein